MVSKGSRENYRFDRISKTSDFRRTELRNVDKDKESIFKCKVCDSIQAEHDLRKIRLDLETVVGCGFCGSTKIVKLED